MIRNQGRNGDTMLAHINPEEAEMLQEMGGSGTTNPNTGLPEYFFGGLGGIVPSLFGGGNSTAGLGSLFGLLPSMTATSPKSSSGILGGILANPEIMKKVIESGALGMAPKVANQMTNKKPNSKTELPKKTKKENINIDDSMFGALLPNSMGSIATGALPANEMMGNEMIGNKMIGGALAPSMKSNIGNIIRKMNPEDLAKGYAMSGRWEE
jgi:hypothetical protein